MSLPSELTVTVQCLGRHLDAVRQRACDREHLVRATLDSERTALEHKIADNQNRKKEVEALLEVWEHENADAFQTLARLEASYHDSLQRSRSLEAVPDYQHLVGFIFGSASVPARTPRSLPYMHTQDAMMMSEIQNNPEDSEPANTITTMQQNIELSESAVASLRRQMAEGIASHQFDQGHTNDIGHCLPKTQNSIDFEELYEGGKAKYKHRILYFKGQWYILKCDEHGIHFPYRSASAAGSHLRSHWHRGSASNFAAVIKAFGVRVENCNGERADRNNEEFLSALAGGYCVYKGMRESQKRQSIENDLIAEEIIVACDSHSTRDYANHLNQPPGPSTSECENSRPPACGQVLTVPGHDRMMDLREDLRDSQEQGGLQEPTNCSQWWHVVNDNS